MTLIAIHTLADGQIQLKSGCLLVKDNLSINTPFADPDPSLSMIQSGNSGYGFSLT